MWLGFVAWLPLADSTGGETVVGELPLAVCLIEGGSLCTTLHALQGPGLFISSLF